MIGIGLLPVWMMYRRKAYSEMGYIVEDDAYIILRGPKYNHM